MLAHKTPQGKSEKPQPEPKSASPARSSPKIAESEEPQSPAGNPRAKVHACGECPLIKCDEVFLIVSQSSPPPKEDFESYYMKQVTAEFADDIDKLRNAPDFSEQSVPVLINALRQGANAFSEEEKETIMKGRG